MVKEIAFLVSLANIYAPQLSCVLPNIVANPTARKLFDFIFCKSSEHSLDLNKTKKKNIITFYMLHVYTKGIRLRV